MLHNHRKWLHSKASAGFIMLLSGMAIALDAPSAIAGESIGLSDAIRQALTHRSDLVLGRIDSALAETESQRIEGMLDPVVTASIGATDDKSPVASSFQASRTVSGQLQAGISKPMANGDTLGASLAYNRSKQSFSNPIAAQFALINPAYRGQIDLTYRHPLLRGNDRPDYAEALQAAENDTEASRLQQQTIARALALQVTNAYYQLANDWIQVKLANQSVKRAERLLQYQSFRERFGLIEKSDRLQAEALLEARKLDRAQAQAQLAVDNSALNRLLLAPADQRLDPSVSHPAIDRPIAGFNTLFVTASRKRPELSILDARLKAAEARLKQAMDTEESQLDIVAQLGTRSLDTQASAAAGNAFGTTNHYAALSLEYSDTVGNNRAHAAIRKAELTRSRIVEERRQAIDQIRDDLARARTSLLNNIPAFRQSVLRVAAEQKKLDAELKRYREGRSDTATVVQFEGDLSAAERQKELLSVSLNLAEKQLAWAQGTLFEELGIQLPGPGESE